MESIASLVSNTLQRTRGRSLTPHTLAAAFRVWNAVSRDYCLFNLSRTDKLDISAVFLGTGKNHFREWDGGEERAFNVVKLRVRTVRQRGVTALEVNATTPAIFGLHAVARYFERAGTREVSHLLQDMRAVVDGLTEADPWYCSRGSWRGETLDVEMELSPNREHTERTKSVRTFYS
jgi:hypothetical protein